MYIFPLFVLTEKREQKTQVETAPKCKKVIQKDPDQLFREMSHMKAHNFFKFFGTIFIRGP
jgi:hypothetical protein